MRWRTLTLRATVLCVLVTVAVFLVVNHNHAPSTQTVRQERGVAGLSRVGGADTINMGVADSEGNKEADPAGLSGRSNLEDGELNTDR